MCIRDTVLTFLGDHLTPKTTKPRFSHPLFSLLPFKYLTSMIISKRIFFLESFMIYCSLRALFPFWICFICSPLLITGTMCGTLLFCKNSNTSVESNCVRPPHPKGWGMLMGRTPGFLGIVKYPSVSYTHLRAHETVLDLVCRLLLEKK